MVCRPRFWVNITVVDSSQLSMNTDKAFNDSYIRAYRHTISDAESRVTENCQTLIVHASEDLFDL